MATGSEKVMVSYKMAHLASQFLDNTIARGGLGIFSTTEGQRKFMGVNKDLFERIEKLQKRYLKKHHRQITYNDIVEIEFTLEELVTLYVCLGNIASAPRALHRDDISYCDVKDYFNNLIVKIEKSHETVTSSLSSSSSSSSSTSSSTETVEKDSSVSASSSSSSSLSTVDVGSDDDSGDD